MLPLFGSERSTQSIQGALRAFREQENTLRALIEQSDCVIPLEPKIILLVGKKFAKPRAAIQTEGDFSAHRKFLAF